jgi:hypothetical protein
LKGRGANPPLHWMSLTNQLSLSKIDFELGKSSLKKQKSRRNKPKRLKVKIFLWANFIALGCQLLSETIKCFALFAINRIRKMCHFVHSVEKHCLRKVQHLQLFNQSPSQIKFPKIRWLQKVDYPIMQKEA